MHKDSPQYKAFAIRRAAEEAKAQAAEAEARAQVAAAEAQEAQRMSEAARRRLQCWEQGN